MLHHKSIQNLGFITHAEQLLDYLIFLNVVAVNTQVIFLEIQEASNFHPNKRASEVGQMLKFFMKSWTTCSKVPYFEMLLLC